MPLLTLPGLVDPHVHVREPGAVHKEDWTTATAAALAGGFYCVLAMPNTTPPVTDEESWTVAAGAAAAGARCDYGLFAGAALDNVEAAAALADRACGLKLYLDQTFGPLRLDAFSAIGAHAARWPATRPLVVHAEGRSLAIALLLAAGHGRPVHVAHVARAEELALVRYAKERGWPVTCEVTPHHLFLCEDDVPALGPGRSEVRPRLASAADQRALWDGLDVIDCFATDHAPHTAAEKDGDRPPPGFPGLETALPLLLGAVHEGRLTPEALVARMSDNPARIFGVPPQPDTEVRVDPDATWTVRGADLQSRCGWTPFEGRRLRGRVVEVRLRGRVAWRDGAVAAPPGAGHNLFHREDLP